MDEFISRKSSSIKPVIMILTTSYLFCHFTQAAFPIERDVAEITGVSPPKRWIVFIEKRVTACLHNINPKESSSLIQTLKCMTNTTSNVQCLFTIRIFCVLTHIYPNILQTTYASRIKIIVHQQFSLNITILHYFERNGDYLDISHLNIEGKTYTRLLYPFTYISHRNAIEIKFPSIYRGMCARIEYGVAQSFNHIIYNQIETDALYFSWSYFLVRCFRIDVDIRARLVLNITSCLDCKMIVYDGPTGNLPIIMKISGSIIPHRIVASTFQVFVVIVEDVHQQDIGITYAPIYINTAVYAISREEHLEISFDNSTYCSDYSLSARLCAFKFYTSSSNTIQFSLKDLQFTGKHGSSQSTAGIVVFNQFNGTMEKMLELNSNLLSSKTYLDIIGTGRETLVLIFEYSCFTSIALRFSISTANCNILSISDNYIAYSGYITPVYDVGNVFKINQPSQTVLEYDACYKLQFIYTKPSALTFNIVFPGYKPVIITTRVTPIRQKKISFWGCLREHEEPERQSYVLEDLRMPDMSWHKEVTVTKAFVLKECLHFQYIQIQFQILRCKLPCRYFVQIKFQTYVWEPNELWGDSENETCDICENDYIFCNHVRLKTHILSPIRIKSKVCMHAILEISGPSGLYINLKFNRSDIISVIPAFTVVTHAYIHSTSCIVEIPTTAVIRGKINNKRFATWRVTKTLHWDGAVYRSIYRHLPVSWETAASYCHKIGTSLLTIHSQAEYQFVKKGFLLTHDILTLYLGVKREVIWLYNRTVSRCSLATRYCKFLMIMYFLGNCDLQTILFCVSILCL